MIKTKTRNGGDALVYFIHPNQMGAIHGAIWEFGHWAAVHWQADGRYTLNGDCPLDLIDTAAIHAFRQQCAKEWA